MRSFAAEFGLQVASEDRAARRMKLAGTVRAFNQAFGVSLRRYEHSSGTYRCRTGSLLLPSDLAGIIEP